MEHSAAVLTDPARFGLAGLSPAIDSTFLDGCCSDPFREAWHPSRAPAAEASAAARRDQGISGSGDRPTPPAQP